MLDEKTNNMRCFWQKKKIISVFKTEQYKKRTIQDANNTRDITV